MSPSANPQYAMPATTLPWHRIDFEPLEESWFGLFARFGIGLSPELLELGDRRHCGHGPTRSGTDA